MMRMPSLLRIAAAALLGLALILGAALSGSRPVAAQAPWLRLDTGMHTGAIRDIAIDPAGELVATAGSSDKTIRVWSLMNGALISTIRPYVGEGEIGRVDSLAFLPNGQGLLAGIPAFDSAPGLRQGSVYLFRLDNSPPMRLRNLVAPVNRLVFAPSGDRFAGTMLSGGLTVWSNRGERLFQERVPGREFVDVEIGPFGLTAAALDDGTVQLRDGVTHVTLAVYQAEGGGRSHSLSINADGTLMAVGYSDRPYVDILSIPSMERRQRLGLPDGGDGNLAVVAWGRGANSAGLYAAGTATNADGLRVLAFWSEADGGARPATLPIARDSVLALAATPDGGVVFAASDPVWGRAITTPGGGLELIYAPRPRRLGFREQRNSGLAADEDGAVIDFRANDLRNLEDRQSHAFRFDLQALRLEEIDAGAPLNADDPDSAGEVGAAGPTVDLEPGGGTVSVGGHMVRLDGGERALSAAATAGRDETEAGSAWLGTDFFLRQVGADGTIQASVLTPGPVWSVAAAGPGIAVAALGDGTIRWYRRQGDDLVERLALFVHADRRRWVAWTPDGAFAHSERGVDDLIGFQINGQAGDLSSTWYDLSQLYDLFFQPDRVRAALSDSESAVPPLDTVFADLALPAIEWLGYCDGEGEGRAPQGVDFLAGEAATRALARVRDEPAAPAAGTASVEGSGAEGAADGRCTALGSGTRGLVRVATAGIAEPGGGVADVPETAASASSPGNAGDATEAGPSQAGDERGGDETGSEATGAEPEWGPQWVELLFAVTDRGGGIDTIDVFVNGRNAGRTDATRGLARVAEAGPPPSATTTGGEDDPARVIVRRFVQLDPGNNEILLRAYSDDGLFSRSERIVMRGPRPEPEPEPPRLFVFAVGIDAYQGTITPLNYAVADATSVANTVRSVARGLYQEVEVDLVVDEEADRSGIMERLAAFTEEVRPEDALLVYLAGHGITDDEGDYIFVPRDVERREQLDANGLDQDMLIAALSEVPARNLFLFLDTCYAGTFDLEVGGKIAAESGRFVLTASTSVQEALDSYDGVNGVFARAVLDGIEGGAAATGNVVDALFLGAYVRDRVPQLAARRNFDQAAVFKTAGGEIRPFPVAAVGSAP